jgi:hypothetical protein
VADSPVRCGILGTGGIEVDGGFCTPATVTLIPRNGDPAGVQSVHERRDLRREADEVARRLAAGGVESPLMPLRMIISTVETAGMVLARVWRNA